MTIALPNPVDRYRRQLDSLIAKRQEIGTKLSDALMAGDPGDKLAEQAIDVDQQIERARLTLAAIERAAAESQRAVTAAEDAKARKKLDKLLAEVEGKAESFERLMLEDVEKSWRDYLAALSALDRAAADAKLDRPTTAAHRPHFVWDSVFGRFLRDLEQIAPPALRQSATPTTLAHWWGKKKRTGLGRLFNN